MTLDSNRIKELKNSFSERIYIQVEKWNLYLGDAGLAEALALECNAYLDQGASKAARQALESVQVKFAGGSTHLPLARLIPPDQIFDLEEILEPYCN